MKHDCVKLQPKTGDAKDLQVGLDRLLLWTVAMDLHVDPVKCQHIRAKTSDFPAVIAIQLREVI